MEQTPDVAATLEREALVQESPLAEQVQEKALAPDLPAATAARAVMAPEVAMAWTALVAAMGSAPAAWARAQADRRWGCPLPLPDRPPRRPPAG